MFKNVLGKIFGNKVDDTPTIRKSIAEAKNKDISEVTDDDFLAFNQMAMDKFISKEDLEKLIELDMLYIENSDFSDESTTGQDDGEKIKCLKKLKKLELVDYNFSDLEFLKELPELKELYLTACSIDDYEALNDLGLNGVYIVSNPPFEMSDMPFAPRVKITQSGKMYAPSLNPNEREYKFESVEYLDISKLMVREVAGMFEWKVRHLVISYDFANSEDFQDIFENPFNLYHLKVLTIDNTFDEEDISELIEKLQNMKPHVLIETKGDNGISINMPI